VTEGASKFFFRQRQRNRLFDNVVEAIEDASASNGIRRKDIAEKLSVNPSQVSRWLSGPANWEQDTISDLLFAIDAELEFRIVPFSELERKKSNHFHPRGEPPEIILAPTTTNTSTASISLYGALQPTRSGALIPSISTVMKEHG
jgi:transcriptional regulator with XRE-family HTH domain